MIQKSIKKEKVVSIKEYLTNNIQPHRFVRTKKHPFSQEVLKRLRPLHTLDNINGLKALLEDYSVLVSAITGSIWILQNTSWFWFLLVYPIALIVIGSRQRGFATLLHESSHGILCKNKQLNFVIGTYFSAYLIFQTFYPYKKSHCQEHHRHLGDKERDPDLQYYISQGLFEVATRSEFLKKYLLPNLLFIKMPWNLYYLIVNRLLIDDFCNQPKRVKVEYIKFIIYWIGIAILLTITNTWIYFLLFWLIPFLTTFQALNCTIEVCEHYPLIVYSNEEIYMTRNRNGNWIERFIFGIHGENYHLLHHLFAGIPFWNLSKAHQILLEDEEYKFIDERSGGIITKSKIGNTTIIGSMFEPLEKFDKITKKEVAKAA